MVQYINQPLWETVELPRQILAGYPMLNVKIRVEYENDWSANLREYDVFGQFLASTFRGRRYLGIVILDIAADEYEEVLETIREHSYTESLEVIESHEKEHGRRRAVTLNLHSTYIEYTPLQILLYEGYLPFGAFGELENGKMSYDLLIEDRDSISDAVALLREFGNVEVEYITQDFQTFVVPSVTEWQDLLQAFPVKQRELLSTALKQGYYEMPREINLEELADEAGVAKTTASQHLRKAERRVMQFLIQYINLAATA